MNHLKTLGLSLLLAIGPVHAALACLVTESPRYISPGIGTLVMNWLSKLL